MKRRILVTNDDGIRAHGIARLAEAAKDFGEVWVVAPEKQRSAASHGISLHDPLDVLPAPDFPVEGVHAFSCSGSPADCVRVGLLHVAQGGVDVVLSGINHGYNVGTDIQYSGTVGAAFEGAFHDVRSIAFSECTGSCVDVTDKYIREILEELIDRDLGRHHIWNVNFPTCELDEFQGILRDRTVSHGSYFRDHYNVQEELPGGGLRLMVEGLESDAAEEGSDMRALAENYASIGILNNIGFHSDHRKTETGTTADR